MPCCRTVVLFLKKICRLLAGNSKTHNLRMWDLHRMDDWNDPDYCGVFTAWMTGLIQIIALKKKRDPRSIDCFMHSSCDRLGEKLHRMRGVRRPNLLLQVLEAQLELVKVLCADCFLKYTRMLHFHLPLSCPLLAQRLRDCRALHQMLCLEGPLGHVERQLLHLSAPTAA